MNGNVKFIEKHWRLIAFIITMIVTWTMLTRDVRDNTLALKQVDAKWEINENRLDRMNEMLIQIDAKLGTLVEGYD